MKYNHEIHHRRSIRLKGYDYSQSGLYFITICTQNREHIFGTIENGKISLNEYGNIVKNEWIRTPKIRKEIELHEYIVMPNHIHGIVEITDGRGDVYYRRGDRPVAPTTTLIAPMVKSGPKQNSIGSLIAGYKSSVTKQINILRGKPGVSIWQRNYYEQIIRNKRSYYQISEYIKSNPGKWQNDKYHE